MVALLRHRGPDDEGTWAAPGVVLGHTRLSIIDIAGGHQPMFNETATVALVFNGEIYNFEALRRELLAFGHDFRVRSDTEVIVHGYEQWGDDVVGRLRGMFAFALWDSGRRRLLLARDRLGEKPLYVHSSDGALFFASEIKALLAVPGVPRELNEKTLPEYLAYRCVAGSATMFRSIEEIEAGTLMVAEPGKRSVRRYWSGRVPVRRSVPFEEAAREGERLLEAAIRYRLVADVGLGTLTSGGLDSSLTTAIAVSQSGSGSMDTFCVGFDEPGFDERPYADLIARHVGSRHHAIEVTARDIERELDRLTWAHDEPLTHPNSVPMHLIFRHAKEVTGVTVVLSGEGADELFGGYAWYRALLRREALCRVPLASRVLSGPVGRPFRVLQKVLDPEYVLVANAVSDRAMVASVAGSAPDLRDRHRFWPADRPGVDGMFLYDQDVYLPPLLQRQDRMSMAAGVEARVVFLDHHLVEWANALPASVKLAGGIRKALLKRIAASRIPAAVIEREKVGFTLPLGRWLRPGGPLHDRLQALRDPHAFLRRYTVPSRIESLIEEHARGTVDHADVLWTLLALEAWASLFVGAALRPQTLPGATWSRIAGTRPPVEPVAATVS
jgi:asparagine synthase (glutamine-hydrolysing)